jgi:hypothetical protein
MDFQDGNWDTTIESMLTCQLEDGSFAAEKGLSQPDVFSTQQALIALKDISNGQSVFKRLPFKLSDERKLFSDGHLIAQEYVSDTVKAYNAGLMLGNGNREFLPKANLKRSELAAVLARLFAATSEFQTPSFSDINSGDWYYKYVAKVVSAGYMDKENEYFYPDRPATHGELALAACRLLGIDVKDGSVQNAVCAAADAGLIDRSWSVSPTDVVTREQAAGVFVRIYEKQNSEGVK